MSTSPEALNTSFASPRAAFANVPDMSAGCTSGCGCDTMQRIEVRDSDYPRNIRKLGPDGRSDAGLGSWAWAATIHIDPGAAQITVTTNMLANNVSGDRFPGRAGMPVPISQADFQQAAARVPDAITSYWNAEPYRIRLTYAASTNCDPKTFTVMFNPRMYFSSGEIEGNQHYRADIYNIPSLAYSQVSTTDKILRLNVGMNKTGTDQTSFRDPLPSADSLEAHEYGHMIGIRDLYVISNRSGRVLTNGASFNFVGVGDEPLEHHNDQGIVAVRGNSPDAGAHVVPHNGGTVHACMMGHSIQNGINPRGYLLPLAEVIKRRTSYAIDTMEIL